MNEKELKSYYSVVVLLLVLFTWINIWHRPHNKMSSDAKRGAVEPTFSHPYTHLEALSFILVGGGLNTKQCNNSCPRIKNKVNVKLCFNENLPYFWISEPTVHSPAQSVAASIPTQVTVNNLWCCTLNKSDMFVLQHPKSQKGRSKR